MSGVGEAVTSEGDGCEQSHGAGKALCGALWTSVIEIREGGLSEVDRVRGLAKCVGEELSLWGM